MRRWVKEEQIDVEAVYMSFARQILEALSHLPLFLVMDGSLPVGSDAEVYWSGTQYK